MIILLTKRVLLNIATLLIIISLAYIIIKTAPGNPFEQERAQSQEVMNILEKKYSFTYWEYLSGILQGDLKYSYRHPDKSVAEIIKKSLPVSLELGGLAILLAGLIGIMLGTIAALHKNTSQDFALMAFAMAGIAIPNFVLGPLLQYIFATQFRWLNIAGWMTVQDRILPVITLSGMYIAYIARITRGSVLETLNQEFIRVARAKGLSEGRIIWAHIMRNSMIPVLNYIGPATAAVLTGTLVIEKIFNIPGLGRHFVESALQRDYPVALGVLITYSVLLLVINLIVDIIQSLIDPRIRFQ
jgi:oligopeptide transport system permease protein